MTKKREQAARQAILRGWVPMCAERQSCCWKATLTEMEKFGRWILDRKPMAASGCQKYSPGQIELPRFFFRVPNRDAGGEFQPTHASPEGRSSPISPENLALFSRPLRVFRPSKPIPSSLQSSQERGRETDG